MLRKALAEAEDLWRAITQRAYPLYGNKEVVRVQVPQTKAPLSFYTDDERIFIELNDVEGAERDFNSHVHPIFSPLTSQSESELWRDILLFVLFHELYHPLVCPDSLEDEREVSCAIYRGFTESENRARAANLAHNVKNLFWDLIVNVTYLARSLGGNRSYFLRASESVLHGPPPTKIVPALYYQSACLSSTDLLIATMGALYTELSVDDEKTKETLQRGFDKEGQRLGAEEAPSLLARKVLEALLGHQMGTNRRRTLVKLLENFEDSRERYLSIERAASCLAPFVTLHGPQGTLDGLTRGHRGTAQEDGGEKGNADSWQDLAEGLSSKELDELEEALAKHTGALSGSGDGASPGAFGTPAYLMAADSHYKRVARPLSLRQPNLGANVMDVGKQKRWKLKNVVTLSKADVARLDHNTLQAFQSTTGLPLLLELAEGHYQLNEYELVTSPLKAYTLVDDLTIADNWVLFVDSSGSMASSDYVGSGSYYDLLMHVCYGVAKGMWKACERLGRDLSFGVVNFSTTTKWSGMLPFKDTYQQVVNEVKKTLLIPQSGGTSFDVEILKTVERELEKGTTVYSFITDGEIEREEQVLEALLDSMKDENKQLLFIEIGMKSQLGVELDSSKLDNVGYFHLDKVEDIEEKLGHVLLSYDH